MRILLLAYYHPPIPGGGSQRPRWMARRLHDLGHDVTVLAAGYGGPDPGDGVVRVPDPSHNRNRRGVRAAQWLAMRLAVEAANRGGWPVSVYTPWRRRVVAAARALDRRSPFDLLLATYPPAETLQAGLELAAAGGPPLVADLRDGLLFEPIEASRLRRYPAVRRHYRRLEEAVLESAAGLVTAHPDHAQHLRRRGAAGPVAAIPNGWDPDDFAGLPQVTLEPGVRHLVHAGGIAASDPDCDLAPLAAALEEVADGPARARLRLHQLGRLTARERRRLGGLRAAGVLVDHGVVDRPRCLALERAAEALLLVASPRRPSVAPGKLFEYLAAGPPVLAVAPDGFASEILRETGCGITVAPDDVGARRAALEAVATGEPLPGRPRRDDRAVERHSVAARAGELDRFLRRAVATLGGARPGAGPPTGV